MHSSLSTLALSVALVAQGSHGLPSPLQLATTSQASLTFQSPYWSPILSPLSSLVSSLSSVLQSHPHTRPKPHIKDADAPHFVVYGYSDNGSPTGVPDPDDINGFNVYNVAFYTSKDGATGALTSWVNAAQSDRDYVKQRYADAGISLIMSVGGADDLPQSDGQDPAVYARQVARFAQQYNFDGVDLDYEEFDIFGRKSVIDWLTTFTLNLRDELGDDAIITHAPIAPWFSQSSYPKGSYIDLDNRAGYAINWYNIQFYNQGKNTYSDCDSLLWDSTPSGYPTTSIFEINRYGGIDNDKLVIGKPGIRSDASDGYMTPTALGKCVNEGVQNGWQGGVMFWEYPDMTASKLHTIRSVGGI